MFNIDPLLDIPPILHSFHFNAPQIVRGGTKRSISLVKCPPIDLELRIRNQEAPLAWSDWWGKTEWALDPRNSQPRWNSTSRTGHVWTQFGEAAQIPDGQPFIFCLRCSLALQHPQVRGIGTKHMTNHLESRQCQKTSGYAHSQSAIQIAQAQQNLQQKPQSNTIPVFSARQFEEELVRLIADNNWSFRTVERASFYRFVQFLRQGVTIPKRYKFTEIFKEQFQRTQELLLQDLEKTTKISIALDGWSANNHLSFLAIKAYYITDRWQAKEKLLDFIPIRGSHTGASMATELIQVLSSTNTEQRLLAITADNAGNNGTLRATVERLLLQKDITWKAEENTIPCLAHVINLVVQEIIRHLKLTTTYNDDSGLTLQKRHIREIQSSVSVPNSLRKVSWGFITGFYHILITVKLRAICVAIDRSPQRYERFNSLQQSLPANERLSVIRDVKTRWNSTFDMCERALKLREFIDQWLNQEIAQKMTANASSIVADEDIAEVDFRDLKRLRLSHSEWHHLEIITGMLQRFKDATTWLSQTQQPQIQYIWLMYNRLFDFLDTMTQELEEDVENEDGAAWPEIVRKAAAKGRAKLSKYYGSTVGERGFLFNCGTILDPTQKLTAYEVR